jgi:hypothetical protein
MLIGMYAAKIVSYDADTRTAMVTIPGFTDGVEGGLEARFAYPIGDDDFDTEREVLANADVYVFFEQGQRDAPVIAFYRSHNENAVVDVRRIRQKNIELLARANIQLEAPTIHIKGDARVVVESAVVEVIATVRASITGPMVSINGA